MVGDGYFLILGSRGKRGEIFFGEVLGMPKRQKMLPFLWRQARQDVAKL